MKSRLTVCLALSLTCNCLVSAGEPNEIKTEQPTYTDVEREHWAYQPIHRPPIPRVKSTSSLSATDPFVLSRLEEAGLSLNRAASKETLIRRLSLDLLGLPPELADIKSFVRDQSPDAYEQVVDRYLADPRYGERWGQHWLDVVRFAESEGFEYDRHLPGAWRFRDYVIDAFNADMPFAQFVTEQLAGDELAKTKSEPSRHRLLVAAGFHRLGAVRRNAGNAEVAFSRYEVLTEMTDIVGTAFLGLTVGCARCHDHMFDAIRQQDYYQLQAFLGGANEKNVTLASKAEQDAWNKKSEAVQKEIAEIKERLAKATGELEQELTQQLYAAQDRLPDPLPTICTVEDLPAKRTKVHLLQRGDPERKGQRMGMRTIGIISRSNVLPLPEAATPRTRLAKWITSKDNPLTARVIVNRIWQHHFGVGIAGTPNDLGVNGHWPTHPELLDYLAHRLIESDWSLKSIHRLILLSHTYRQSSHVAADHPGRSVDPENELLWRFRRRRLGAEEIRDSMLLAADRLNSRMGGHSVLVPVDPDLVGLLYKPSQWVVTRDERQHDRRSVYLMAKRNLQVPFLEVFDKPGLQTSCARREQSTHAPQALELLNGKLSNELAESFAKRLESLAGDSIPHRVEVAFMLVAGRTPTPREKELATRFAAANPGREFALAMFNLNAFLYVD